MYAEYTELNIDFFVERELLRRSLSDASESLISEQITEHSQQVRVGLLKKAVAIREKFETREAVKKGSALNGTNLSYFIKQSVFSLEPRNPRNDAKNKSNGYMWPG